MALRVAFHENNIFLGKYSGTIADANGNVHQFHYDKHGHLKEETRPEGVNTTATTLYITAPAAPTSPGNGYMKQATASPNGAMKTTRSTTNTTLPDTSPKKPATIKPETTHTTPPNG